MSAAKNAIDSLLGVLEYQLKDVACIHSGIYSQVFYGHGNLPVHCTMKMKPSVDKNFLRALTSLVRICSFSCLNCYNAEETAVNRIQKVVLSSNLAFYLGGTNAIAHGALSRNNQSVLMRRKVYLSGHAHLQL